MFVSLKRIIKSGFQHFYRNPWLSASAIFAMTLVLFVIAGLLLSSVLTNAIADGLKSKIDITVYFNPEAEENVLLNAKKLISILPEVQVVEYISKSEALERFKEKHQDSPLILQSLTELETNPLKPHLNIKSKDPSQYAKIVEFVEKSSFVENIDKISYYENQKIIEKAAFIINAAKKAILAVSIILALAALLTAFNTVRITIYTNREKINILRLIGASNWFIKGPFLVKSLLYAIISSIIVVLMYWPITLKLSPLINRIMPQTNLYEYYLNNFWQLFAVLLAVSSLIGILGGIGAINRYLKK